MSSVLPRLAAVAAVACAASALAVPLAVPAGASAPVEKLFIAADANSDAFGQAGLYLMGAAKPVVAESDTVDVYDVSSSADGSRVIYVQDNYTVSGDPINEQVIVRDVSTRQVRVIDQIGLDDTRSLTNPQLSPDGNTAVWEYTTYTANGTPSLNVRKAEVGVAPVSLLKAGYSPYAFLDATTLLVQNLAGQVFTLPAAGGDVAAATGVPADAQQVAVSPDGSHLAWSLVVSSSASQIQVASWNSGTSTATVTATVSPGSHNVEPAFSRNGGTVYFVHDAATSALYSVPATGGTAKAVSGTGLPSNPIDVAVLATDDGVPPAAIPSTNPAVLMGSTAVLDWVLPTGTSDLSGTLITKQHGADIPVYTYVPAPQHTFSAKGLVVGQTYTFTFAPLDRTGRYGSSSSRTVVALQAAPTFADPTARTSTRAPFPVTFGPAAPAGTLFYAKWGTTGVPWTDWVTGAAGRVRTFGAPATTNVLATTSTPGKSYTFQVRATDGHGNSTPWVNSGRAVVPFDQTKATYSGGGTASDASAYFGSYRKLWHTSDIARVTLTGNRFTILGLRCSTCGLFDVFENGAWIGTVNGYSATTQERQVLFTKSYTGIGTHSYAIRSRAISGRADAKLDAFAMRT